MRSRVVLAGLPLTPDEKVALLAQLPWSVRTGRSEVSGDHLAWILELPGTCARAATAEELPGAIAQAFHSYIRVALYFNDPIQLPAGIPTVQL